MDMVEVNKAGLNCYIYTRVSTEIQIEGFSLSAQLQECQKMAEIYKMNVVGIYSDEGKSGKDVEGRPEFQRMMRDIEYKNDNVSFILVFKLSRFGRNATEMLSGLNMLKKKGVYLWSVKDSVDNSTMMGQFLITILSAMAEMERVNILEQTQAGRIQKAKAGKWNGGKPPIGYSLNKDTGTLVVNEDEAKIVREVYNKYVKEKMSYNAIARYINSRYEKPKRQKNDNPLFSAYNIIRMLDDETYTGVITYGKTYVDQNTKTKSGKAKRHKQTDSSKIVSVPGNFEAIIDKKLWDEAHSQRNEAKEKHTFIRNAEKTHIYPLTGLIKCPVCGARLNGRTERDGTAEYSCRNHQTSERGHKKCSFNRYISEPKICEEICKIINAVSVSEEFTSMVAKRVNSAVDVSGLEAERDKFANTIRNLKSSIKQREYELDHTNYEDEPEIISIKTERLQERLNSLYGEMSQYNREIKAIEAKIAKIKEAKYKEKQIFDILKNFNIMYSKFNDEEKRTCLHLLIESIEIQNYETKVIDYSKIVKGIKFRFYLDDNPDKPVTFHRTNDKHGESVVLLTKVHT